ncbi:hypothetical protein LDENG_00239540 [Lucifuga dentata]|nr:hypothetical protein LDENG_00239540 [Lucifuga dentata]
MVVWKVGKTILIHGSSGMLWEMIVSNVTCMKIEYIRVKHAKWVVWSFTIVKFPLFLNRNAHIFKLVEIQI